MKTQTKVQQVKTKKNWYHVSSSKMSAKAEGYCLLDMNTTSVLMTIQWLSRSIFMMMAPLVGMLYMWTAFRHNLHLFVDSCK